MRPSTTRSGLSYLIAVTAIGLALAAHVVVHTLVGYLIVGAAIIYLTRLTRRAERRARRRERSLRARDAEREAVMMSMGEGLYTVDTEGRVTFINPSAERLLGWEGGELLGRKMHDATHYLHPDGTPFPASECAGLRVLRDGIQLADHEDTFIRKDGTFVPVLYSSSRIVHDGKVTGLAVVFRDVTRQRQAEAEREQLLGLAERARADAEGRLRDTRAARAAAEEAARSLEATSRAKDEFLAMLSHELRNPLAAVRTAVAAAGLDAAQAPRALEIARRQAEQLGRLIDDLLDVARITQGRVALRKERVRLADVVERAVDGMRAFIEERRIGLAVRLPPASVDVEADPTRLEQVLVNLLSNAAKYTEAGGCIDVVGEPLDGGQVAVRIRDTGVGIAPEMLPRVWELFAQADREIDRKQGGLGVGLTVARRLVEQHGARIEARSDGIGKGAEFVVTLEALPAAADPAPATEPVTARPAGARVLLVEDNRDAAESLTMLLDLYGHRVRTVYDGFAALDAARAEAPDVMLVDIGLPGIDGYEVARRIRGDAAFHAVRLIALTGYGRDEDRQAALAAGFDHHLVKPVNPDRLHGLVTAVVTEGSQAAGR